jgi:hypothetical protein
MAMATTKRAFVFDSSTGAIMNPTDQIGSGWSVDENARWEVGFQLQKFNYLMGWTWDYLQTASGAELDRKFKDAQIAYQRALLREFKRALYYSANATVYDKFGGDNLAITVRRFWNNDGSNVPPNSSGTSFATTHQHYIGIATSGCPTYTEIGSIVTKVTEHDNMAVKLIVNINDVAALKTVTGFTALTSPLMNPASTSTTTIQTLDLGNLDNKVVGIWDGTIPVVTRPWANQGYVLAMDDTADPKPVAYRTLENPTMRGLLLTESNDHNKLLSNESLAYFGMSVCNRGAGAVLDITSGSSTYTSPTIA